MIRAAAKWRLRAYSIRLHYKFVTINTKHEVYCMPESGLGMLKAVWHSVSVEGFEPGWDHMPKPLGSDEAEWQT